MLGKPKASAPTAETPTKISSIIGPGAIFDGNLNTPETTRVDGTINGNCNCEQNLILGPDGAIKGNIVAQNVIISGKVEGDIYARGKLELYPTGRLTGNISAKSPVFRRSNAPKTTKKKNNRCHLLCLLVAVFSLTHINLDKNRFRVYNVQGLK